MAADRVDLGTYTVGEVPFPLTYVFRNDSNTALDLSGYTAQFQWASRGTATPYEDAVTEPATITNPTGGVVEYTWDGDEFAVPGRYAGLFWVGDGVNRLASELHVWTVCLSVDNPPLI